MSVAMARRLTIRRMSDFLGVSVPTAFRWRHRVLEAAVEVATPPVLAGDVAACESYVRYSEKGSRKTNGPGAWGRRKAPLPTRLPDGTRYQRFIHEKPSCVLIACNRLLKAVKIVGRGRPRSPELQAALAPVLGIGARLRGRGSAPYAEVCRCLGVPYQDASFGLQTEEVVREADRLLGRLRGWFGQFRGVATRYLDRYLAWFCATGKVAFLAQAA